VEADALSDIRQTPRRVRIVAHLPFLHDMKRRIDAFSSH